MKYDDFNIHRNQRSDLADEMEKYWVGRKRSNIGMQYLALKSGKVVDNGYIFERRDLLVLQWSGHMNVFVEPDGSYGAQLWTEFREDFALTEKGRKKLGQFVKRAIMDNQKFFDHEVKFLDEKPWEQVYGMTPELAVIKLRELGW
jgi:hypothetical protein